MQSPHSDFFQNSRNPEATQIERMFTHALQNYLENSSGDLPTFLSITLPFQGSEPFLVLQSGQIHGPKFFWEQPDQSQAHLAIGVLNRFRATGEERFRSMGYQMEHLRSSIDSVNLSELDLNQIPLFSGGYSFEPYNVSKEWREFGSSQFLLPKVLFTKREKLLTVTLNLDTEIFFSKTNDPKTSTKLNHEELARRLRPIFEELNLVELFEITDQVRTPNFSQHSEQSSDELESTLPRGLTEHSKRLEELRNMSGRTSWIQRVGRAIGSIEAAHFQKIVLAREVLLKKEEEFSALPMLTLLRREFPDCTLFYVEMESGNCFLGASPERLVKIQNQQLDTDALAGSAPRGEDDTSDLRFTTELIQSQKDLDEHQFVLREIIDSLGEFSSNIVHTTTPGIRKLKNVQHLHTPIRATLDDNVSIHDIIETLHPTPAVGGYPVKQSLLHIRDLEQLDRGWYSGAVGWFNLSGDGEFTVAIRSAFIEPEFLHLYAGCGIIKHSDPEKEWEETCMKLESLYAASQFALERNKFEF